MDEEYPDCSAGLDAGVLNALSLDKETTLAYLRDVVPSYLEFEAWVLEQKGGAFGFALQDAAVRWNASVRARRHTRPAKIEETYTDIGLGKGAGIDSAVVLNSLQDWQLFYKRNLETDFAGALGGRVVPLIATIDYGPLGICQLPRTWYKVLLKPRDLLHPDYPDMTQSGLDPRVLEAAGVEVEATLEFIRGDTPSYLEFEAWVLEQNGGELDSGPVDEWNDYVRNRVHNDQKQVDIRATIGREEDGDLSSAVVLNQLEDWHLAYRDLVDNR